MTSPKAIHMLSDPSLPNDGRVLETLCHRRSMGGGTGRQILSFAGDNGTYWEATAYGPAVTCRKCLKLLKDKDGAVDEGQEL